MTRAQQPLAGEQLPPPLRLRQLLTGYWIAQCVHVAARLGLADLLQDGPRSSEELARATDTHGPSLYRMLRALASEGVFVEDEQGRFALTPVAACLLSNAPLSQRSAAIMMGEEHFHAWGDLLYSIQTGKPAFDRLYGQPIFDYLAGHPGAAAVFDAAMTGIHGAETAAMLDAYDFSGIGTLVDVGGGNGTLLAVVLQRYPALRAILFDRPDVVERAAEGLRAAGVTSRCNLVGGDFFRSVPAGGDVYLLRHIIHDWDDERALTILRHCRAVMPPEGRLLLIETVIPAGNGPSFGKWLDVNMLVLPGGKERTEAEYRALLAEAGFRLARIVPTRMELEVIEGKVA